MKKVLLSLFMFIGLTSLSAQTNLILNGDFEEWDFWSGDPKNWSRNIGAFVNKVTDKVNGDYAAEVESDDRGVGFIVSEKMNLQAGKKYNCSFYYKVINGDLTKFDISLRSHESIFPESVLTTPIDNPKLREWVKYEFTYEETTDRELDLQFLFWTDNKASVLFDEVYFYDESTTGVNTENTGNLLNIYPNPASDYIIINTADVTFVEIYDITGKNILSTVTTTDNKVDISHLSKGTYLVYLHTEGKVTTSKLVKK